MKISYFAVERRQRGITQKELAKEFGVSRCYISQIENGKETPGKYLTYQIERYFNKPMSYLTQVFHLGL